MKRYLLRAIGVRAKIARQTSPRLFLNGSIGYSFPVSNHSIDFLNSSLILSKMSAPISFSPRTISPCGCAAKTPADKQSLVQHNQHIVCRNRHIKTSLRKSSRPLRSAHWLDGVSRGHCSFNKNTTIRACKQIKAMTCTVDENRQANLRRNKTYTKLRSASVFAR